MTAAGHSTVCIACGVFLDELQALAQEEGALPYEIRYLDSMLHMEPEQLADQLSSAIKEEQDADRKVVLLYGDCHPHMSVMTAAKNIKRPAGVNCCQMLLGKERYRQLQRAGTFFVMPEWLKHWREVFENHLGFTTQRLAQVCMNDIFRQIVYIDSGLAPPPRGQLDAIAAFTGLPVVIELVTLEHFRRGIDEAVDALHEEARP